MTRAEQLLKDWDGFIWHKARMNVLSADEAIEIHSIVRCHIFQWATAKGNGVDVCDTYIRNLILNRVIDYTRSRVSYWNRCPSHIEELDTESGSHVNLKLAARLVSTATIEQTEKRLWLDFLLRQIPSENAEALLVSVGTGDHSEGARQLGLSLPAYKSRLYRAKELIRAIAGGG